jgi:hypothetical protein
MVEGEGGMFMTGRSWDRYLTYSDAVENKRRTIHQ